MKINAKYSYSDLQQQISDICNIIENSADKKIETCIREYKSAHGRRIDIYLPNGCARLEWRGKVGIECKWGYNADIFESLRILYDEFHLDTLVVFLDDNAAASLSKYEDFFWESNNVRNIIFCSYEEFFNQHEDIHTIRYKNQQSAGTSVTDIIDTARADAQSRNCSIFIGSGVSVSCGMPDWKSLLITMICAKNEGIEYKSIQEKCGFVETIVARYIRDVLYLKDDNAFFKALQNALYSLNSQPDSECVKTLKAYILKHNIDNIITYNYDSLLEEALGWERVQPIYDNIPYDKDEKIHIYHVHGLIPRYGKELIPFVLDESQYHNLYNTPFHWSNVVQLNALRSSVCFFIGLSLKDPNLRRLLDAAYPPQQNAIWHYAFIMEPNSHNCEKEKEDIENLLDGLRVKVLWYKNDDKHSYLPPLMKKIFM